MTADFPSFPEFYRAINAGRDPFPWQARLSAQVLASGWPSEIGVATGLGKTACIDIAVWALAAQGQREPTARSAPTRIWYVVNRRLLVDTAYDHGLALQSWLADPESLKAVGAAGSSKASIAAVGAVADALASMVATPLSAGPLHVTRLRGGAELGARPPDPAQPALIFATVPMFASRWLFRGYGTSQSMRPVDAALAGIDSLVLLDEAHLARPLMALAAPLSDCDIGDPTRVITRSRARPAFVALTATGEPGSDRFDLDVDDQANSVIAQRLRGHKPARLVSTTRSALAASLANEAAGLLAAAATPASCVIFTNTPAQARAVADRMVKIAAKAKRDDDVVVITGRLRDREADAYRTRLLDRQTGAPSSRDRSTGRQRNLVVVATQTLEVGTDLDFDVLVTESAGVRALTQRLGRLNRLGLTPQASAVIVHPSDRKADESLYGSEPDELWARLAQQAPSGIVDVSPACVGDVLGTPSDQPPRVGEVLPAHVWEWAKTSCPPVGEAPGELFYAGFDDNVARVSVCWRSWLPPDGAELVRSVSEYESLDLPIHDVSEALRSWGLTEVRRLAADRTTIEATPLERIRAGDQLILACADGGYDQFGWAPQVRTPVFDVSLIRPRAEYLPLDAAAVAPLLNAAHLPADVTGILDQLAAFSTDDDDPDPVRDRELAEQLLQTLATLTPSASLTSEEFRTYLSALAPEVVRVGQGNHESLFLARGKTSHFVTVALRSDAFDELSFAAHDAALSQHMGAVGEQAAAIATRLGLPATVVEAVRRAGQFHDLGKLDPRFQRWLDPKGAATEPLAKSRQRLRDREPSRVAAGWPRGGRHELLSAQLLSARITAAPPVDWDPDLITHLVLSHHGHARPSLPRISDPIPQTVTTTIDGAEVAVTANLGSPDWSQPARFRSVCQTYGYWGVALLEAVLRQADHVCSQASEVI